MVVFSVAFAGKITSGHFKWKCGDKKDFEVWRNNFDDKMSLSILGRYQEPAEV
jgi:hypothetical protein